MHPLCLHGGRLSRRRTDALLEAACAFPVPQRRHRVEGPEQEREGPAAVVLVATRFSGGEAGEGGVVGGDGG